MDVLMQWIISDPLNVILSVMLGALVGLVSGIGVFLFVLAGMPREGS